MRDALPVIQQGMLMATFDAAAGVTEATFNDLVTQLYTNPPADNPFKGTKSQDIPGIGTATLSWEVQQAPVITLGPPTQAVWDAALDDKGHTNKADGKPIPDAVMVQLCIPKMHVQYVVGSAPPVGGDTTNVMAYATIAFTDDGLLITLVAISVDESQFSDWDKAIFNLLLVPNIFKAAASILTVVHIPALTWEGVTLETPTLFQCGTLLVAASVETGGSTPVDVSGAQWPDKPLFVLVAQKLINDGLKGLTKAQEGKTHSDSGDFKGLADWDYSLRVNSLAATVDTSDPTKVDATASVSLTAGGKLTAAGMALAAVGCGAGAALLAI